MRTSTAAPATTTAATSTAPSIHVPLPPLQVPGASGVPATPGSAAPTSSGGGGPETSRGSKRTRATPTSTRSRRGGGGAHHHHGGGGLHGASGHSHTRHAPRLSWDSLSDLALALPLTPWAATRHVLSEVMLLFRLALRLWAYLGVGE